MGEFENNGFETTDTVETVENVETIETVETVDATDSYSGTDYTADSGYTTDSSDGSGNGSKVFAIISLVCGILSVLCCCTGWMGLVLSIAAIVLGILSINKQEDAKGMAIAGIVCGAVGVLLGLVIVIMGAAFSAADASDIEQYVEQFTENL